MSERSKGEPDKGHLRVNPTESPTRRGSFRPLRWRPRRVQGLFPLLSVVLLLALVLASRGEWLDGRDPAGGEFRPWGLAWVVERAQAALMPKAGQRLAPVVIPEIPPPRPSSLSGPNPGPVSSEGEGSPVPVLSAPRQGASTQGAGFSSPVPGPRPLPSQGPVRFALEFGPFPSRRDADRVEGQLNLSGLSTVRFQQHGNIRVFTVRFSGFPPEAGAQAILAELAAENLAGQVREDSDGRAWVRVGRGLSLREAVALGERFRSQDLEVRIEASPETVPLYTIRAGNLQSHEEADRLHRELKRQGLQSSIIKLSKR